MSEIYVWVATSKFVGDITFCQLMLDSTKILTVENGHLLSHLRGTKVDLGEFLALGADPLQFETFVKAGDKVVIIPVSGHGT